MIRDKLVAEVLAVAVCVSLTTSVWAVNEWPAMATGTQVGASSVLYTLSFATSSTGCAGGAHVILCTTDAGHTWVRRYSGPATIVDLDLLTPSVGWAVGAHTLLATVDGGQPWTQGGVPSQVMRSVDFVTTMQGWGVVDGEALPLYGRYQTSLPFIKGRLVHTANGGHTWTMQPTAGPVDSICFGTTNDGWATRGATILHTQDGGETWHVVFTPHVYRSAQWLATVHCRGATAAWVLLSLGSGASSQQPYILYRTADAGHHWQPVLEERYFERDYPASHASAGQGGYIGPFSVVDQMTAYILGLCIVCAPQGTVLIMATHNGGYTWRNEGTVPSLTAHGPFAITFVDALHGWVIGTKGRQSAILATSDGGHTLRRQV